MNIMAAGGALCLHQYVDTMHALTGWLDGVHYVGWKDLDNLRRKIEEWLPTERIVAHRKIALKAQLHVLTYHSFDARVKALMEKWVSCYQNGR
jgi:hypothetical protein